MRRSDLVQYKEKENGRIGRTSQIVFGERQHLLRVLDSLEGTSLPIARMQQERRMLEELIHARTRELNHINTAWDEKIGLVLSAEAKPEMLEKLTKQAPKEDFYLLRLISEHPRANAKTLLRLAYHPYGAIRENVARHPNADANTLTAAINDYRREIAEFFDVAPLAIDNVYNAIDANAGSLRIHFLPDKILFNGQLAKEVCNLVGAKQLGCATGTLADYGPDFGITGMLDVMAGIR